MSEINTIIEKLSKLTIIESVELVKKLEKSWGVSSSCNISSITKSANNVSNKKEIKSSYKVVLSSFGMKKISIIKEIKNITGLSLIKAKEIVDSIPKNIKDSVTLKEAERIKTRLEDLGAKVSIE